MEVVPLDLVHTSEVAEMHLRYLPTDLKGTAGRRLLTLYYGTIAAGQGGVGFVAVNDGVVAGFICGIWRPNQLRRAALRKHWLSLAIWGFIQVLRRPKVLLDFAGRMTVDAPRRDHSADEYELRPIVVRPSSRATGVAPSLLEVLSRHASSRGFESIYLLVETHNHRARHFYEKEGFEDIGPEGDLGRRSLRKYVKALEQPNRARPRI